MSQAPGAGAAGETWSRPPRWLSREALVLAVVVAVGFLLRLHDFTLAPLPADNADELGWAWSGLTLLTRHVPYSWSFLQPYRDVTLLVANGTSYRIVHPYFDHPPLFSVLIGGVAWLQGARDLQDVTAAMVRPVAVVLSSLSVCLTYVLGRRLVARPAAMLGAVLLATAPVAVLFGREVESENLLAPLLLLGLLLVHRLLTGEGGRPAIAGLLLCCVVASVTKVPGVAVGLACALVLVAGGRWRLGLVAVGASVAGLGLYALYGALLDWQLFLAVIGAQEARRHGVLGAYEFIVAPAGIGMSIRDGWWILGWIGAGALLAARRAGPRMIPWAALVFVLGILLFTDQRLDTRFGWYRIAVYPLLYTAAAYVCWAAVRDAAVPQLMAMLALGGASAASFGLGSGTTEWMPSALIVGAVLVGVVVPAVVAAMRPASATLHRVAQLLAGAALVAILGLNVVESLNLAAIYRFI